MIVDVHGENAEEIADQLKYTEVYPFTSIIYAKDGMNALELDEVDKLVIVTHGFNSFEEKKEVFDYYMSKRILPRIIEVNITNLEDIDETVSRMNCPYGSIIYIPTGENFRQCLVEIIRAESLIDTVIDLFGQEAGKLVAMYLARVSVSNTSAGIAEILIREARKYVDGDDYTPDVY